MSREIRQGEIWWTRLDPVIGSEQAKTRPVLVVSVDAINRAPAGLAIVCPITTTPRDAAVRIELPRADDVQGEGVRVGYVEPYQVRTVSHARFANRIGAATPEVSREVAYRLALFTRPAG